MHAHPWAGTFPATFIFRSPDIARAEHLHRRVEHLQRKVVERGLPLEHAIHTGLLIRREGEYRDFDLPDRRRHFRHLFDFARIADIRYKTFVFEKRENPEHDALVRRMVRELSLFVRDNLAFFQSFDHIIVYYASSVKQTRQWRVCSEKAA